MSNKSKPQTKEENSVESVIDELMGSEYPIKSMKVITNVIAGVIMGEVDEVDHEHELAAGVTYLVIGLGKLPTNQQRGIAEIVSLPTKGKTS